MAIICAAFPYLAHADEDHAADARPHLDVPEGFQLLASIRSYPDADKHIYQLENFTNNPVAMTFGTEKVEVNAGKGHELRLEPMGLIHFELYLWSEERNKLKIIKSTNIPQRPALEITLIMKEEKTGRLKFKTDRFKIPPSVNTDNNNQPKEGDLD